MAPRSRNDFETAIICALQLEADAVETLFDEIYDNHRYGQIAGDENTYTLGRIGRHDVVLAWMPKVGKSTSAGVVAGLKPSFTRVTLALLVGICAGVPFGQHDEEIVLGDVIFSTQVVEYDSGRRFPDRFERKDTLSQSLGAPPLQIRGITSKLSGRRMRGVLRAKISEYFPDVLESLNAQYPGAHEDKLFEAQYRHKHHKPDCEICSRCKSTVDPVCKEAEKALCQATACEEQKLVVRNRLASGSVSPAIHFGAIASADTVMRSGEERDRIAELEGVIAFEMEGAGVWEKLPCIVIKGVCDYADSHKNKGFQDYASATAASCAKAFLDEWTVPQRSGRTACWSVPFPRNQNFVGRESQLARLEKIVSSAGDFTKFAIYGLGGIGKTALAIEVAHRARERNPNCSVFWIPCSSFETFQQAYTTIGRQLNIPGVEEKGADVLSLVRQHLSTEEAGEWLMVFDNADDLDVWSGPSGSSDAFALKHFVPVSSKGRALLTTRDRQVAIRFAQKHVLDVGDLDDSTACDLLGKLLRREDLLDDTEGAKDLLKQLCYLPLAITQAAAYLNTHPEWISIAKYLRLLSETEESTSNILAEDFDDDGRYSNQKNPVSLTWLVSFEDIRRRCPLAVEYLEIMCFLDSKAIPISLLPKKTSEDVCVTADSRTLERAPSVRAQRLFKKLAIFSRKAKQSRPPKTSHNPPSAEDRGLSGGIEALSLLTSYSFVARRTDQSTIDMHRLVHIAMRNWLKMKQMYKDKIEQVAACVVEAYLRPETREDPTQWRVYVPHMKHLLDFLDPEVQSSSHLLYYYAKCLLRGGRYNEAENACNRDLRTTQTVSGPEHPDTLSSMSNLARIYVDQGRYDKAEKLEVQVLEMRKRVLGLEHPDTLSSISNLARIYVDQGRYDEAEKLGVQVLEMRKRMLGPEHPDTLLTMANYAFTLKCLGSLPAANALMHECSELSAKVLGADHPYTRKRVRWAHDWEVCDRTSSTEDSYENENNESINVLEIEIARRQADGCSMDQVEEETAVKKEERVQM